MTAPVPGMLSREEAAGLYVRLQAQADRKRVRRRLLRRGGAASAFLAFAATAMIVVTFPRGESVAYAFTACGTHDPSKNLHPLVSQLADVPAIALVATAGGQPIRPERVAAKCAYSGASIAAIRVTALIDGRRIALETWYVDPKLKPAASAGTVRLASEATAAIVAGIHDASAYRAADGAIFVRTPTRGVVAITITGAAHEPVPRGIVVGFASHDQTSLVAAYDAALAPPTTAAPTSRASATGTNGFATRTYAVQSVDQVVDHLATNGFERAAILAALQPIKLDIVDVPGTLYAKTTYQDARGQQVRLIQVSKPSLPEIGKVVTLRGTTGMQQGSNVYWDENSWLLVVSTSPAGDPLQLAGEVQWRLP